MASCPRPLKPVNNGFWTSAYQPAPSSYKSSYCPPYHPCPNYYSNSCRGGSWDQEPVHPHTSSSHFHHVAAHSGREHPARTNAQVDPLRRKWTDWRKYAQYFSNIKFHPELRYHSAWHSSSTGVVWDVARHPSSARTLSSRHALIRATDFGSLAMNRTAEKLELRTDHPLLANYMDVFRWGPVPVKENPTVREFLEAIYKYLNTPLTREELELFCSVPQNIRALERARKRRVDTGFDAVYPVAIRGPFTRSDALGECTRFMGVRAARMGDGSDRLYFNLGPGPVPSF